MESPKRKRDRIPKVERSFEWSRLEDQLMALAYEQVLPIVRHRVASQPRSNEAERMIHAWTGQASGA
jgi:hypothetical protein